jgi:hypothetical protein
MLSTNHALSQHMSRFAFVFHWKASILVWGARVGREVAVKLRDSHSLARCPTPDTYRQSGWFWMGCRFWTAVYFGQQSILDDGS